SVALAGGNIHLSYVAASGGLKYVTGQLNADPATWQSRAELPVAGVSIARNSTAPSIAVDSAGNAAIAYWCDDENVSYNVILMYWKPAGGAAPVRIMDS